MVEMFSSEPSQSNDIECLASLLKERCNLSRIGCFPRIQKLVDLEIWRIRQRLFQDGFNCDMTLPEPEGDVVVITEKMFLPRKQHPDVNFVGRIIGPRGMTAKQIERITGCKIMIRGKGSMRAVNVRSRSNFDHLDEKLHVLLQCEDTKNRAIVRIEKAIEVINKIVIPTSKSDDLKRKQLMELAILNGTYRDVRDKCDYFSVANPLSPSSSDSNRPTSHSALSLSPLRSFGSPKSPQGSSCGSSTDSAASWIWKELRMGASAF